MKASDTQFRDGLGRSRRMLLRTPVLAAGVLILSLAAAPPPAAAAPGQVVDVLSAPYSAAGDGLSNDRAAIQAAIDDVGATGGGTVVLPAGHTFLSGNLTMANKVTLKIDGTLKQSQNPDDYTYVPVLGHRLSVPPGTPVPASWVAWYVNYPLIYAGHKKDISVTGSGTIRLTRAPGDTINESDHRTIHLQAIGFYKVTNFDISELTILCQNNDGPDIYWSNDGAIRNLTLDANPPRVCPHHLVNIAGPQIKNSQNVEITGNTITGLKDDGIVVGAVHDDPRDGTWWLSDEEEPTRNIVIRDNVVKTVSPDQNTCGGAVTFIPWATTAKDPSKVGISGIDIYNNHFFANNPIKVWNNDRYHGMRQVDGEANTNNHSAINQVNIHDNEYTNGYQPGGEDLGEAECPGNALRLGRITDLKTEFGAPSESEFLNGDFDGNTAYWSVRGDGGSIRNDVSVLEDPDARKAAQERLRDLGPFGYIQGDDGESAIYQALGLNDGLQYRFRANVMTSGVSAKLFAYNTCTDEPVAELPVDSAAPQVKELVFRANGTCDSYHVGIEQGAGRGWAFIDSASLAPTAEVIDNNDPRIRYTAGSWETDQDLAVLGGSYARARSRPGGGWEAVPPPNACPGVALGEGPNPAVEATFTGSRAWVFGLRRWDYGMADVYVDGEYRATIDLFHGSSVVDGRSSVAWLDHQVLYDTGELPPGEHTIRMVGTGAKNPDSLGIEIVLDAVLVESSGTAEGTRIDAATGEVEYIEDTDPRVECTGDWRSFSDPNFHGGTHISGSGQGSSVTIPFNGSRAQYIARMGRTNGFANVYVDGVLKQTVDFYSEEFQQQQVIYDTGELQPGDHTIRMEATGESRPEATNSTIVFDVLTVYP